MGVRSNGTSPPLPKMSCYHKTFFHFHIDPVLDFFGFFLELSLKLNLDLHLSSMSKFFGKLEPTIRKLQTMLTDDEEIGEKCNELIV